MTEERQTWYDSDGYERIGNEWRFNLFVTKEGATLSAAGFGGKGAVWHIWRLADGTFDFTSTPYPDIPGHPAELVGRIKVLDRSKRKYRELPVEPSSDA